MKLILSGGGAGEQVKESYELFAEIVKGGKVMYIPLAWNNGKPADIFNNKQKQTALKFEEVFLK